MKKIYILILSFIVLNTVNAQNYYWNALQHIPAPTYGEGNLSIAITDDDIIFIGSLNDGLFKSVDNGQSWQLSLACIDTQINKIIDVGNGELIAVAEKNLYRTINKGHSWEKILVPVNYRISDVEILSSGEIIVCSSEEVDLPGGYYDYFGDGILKSNDKGKTWLNINNGVNNNKAISHLAVGPNDIIIASMPSTSHGVGKLLYSMNKGNDWTIMPPLQFQGKSGSLYSVSNIYEIFCVEFDSDGFLYISYEGLNGSISMEGGLKNTFARAINGLTWSPFIVNALGYEWSYRPFYNLYFAKKQNHIYSSLCSFNSVTLGGNYLSTNEGETFLKKNTGIYPVNNSFLKMVYAENSKGRIYAIQLYDHAIYYSDSSASPISSIGNGNKKETTFNIFPNPAQEMVNINLLSNEDIIVDLAISDLTGKIVLQETNIGYSEYKMNISELESSLYLINIKTTSGINVQKLRINK